VHVLTDKAKVLIDNAFGGAIDLAVALAMHVLTGSLYNLANTVVILNMHPQARKYYFNPTGNYGCHPMGGQHSGSRQKTQPQCAPET
jgi:hypothetical protein